MKKVDAIILAGGQGTRLRAVVNDRPKVLAPVHGRPFLDIIMNALENSDIVELVVLAIGYMAEQVIEEYGRNREYPFDIRFSIEEKLLGTGGGIKKALSLTTTEQVLVLNGDSYAEVDLNEFVAFHDKIGAAMTMAVVSVDNATRFGRVFLDKTGRVVSFQEKSADGEGGYINAGVYLFERRLFDSITMDSAISLERELLPQFIKKGVYGFFTKGKFLDIGTPESYRISNDYLSGRVSWKNKMC